MADVITPLPTQVPISPSLDNLSTRIALYVTAAYLTARLAPQAARPIARYGLGVELGPAGEFFGLSPLFPSNLLPTPFGFTPPSWFGLRANFYIPKSFGSDLPIIIPGAAEQAQDAQTAYLKRKLAREQFERDQITALLPTLSEDKLTDLLDLTQTARASIVFANPIGVAQLIRAEQARRIAAHQPSTAGVKAMAPLDPATAQAAADAALADQARRDLAGLSSAKIAAQVFHFFGTDLALGYSGNNPYLIAAEQIYRSKKEIEAYREAHPFVIPQRPSTPAPQPPDSFQPSTTPVSPSTPQQPSQRRTLVPQDALPGTHGGVITLPNGQRIGIGGVPLPSVQPPAVRSGIDAVPGHRGGIIVGPDGHKIGIGAPPKGPTGGLPSGFVEVPGAQNVNPNFGNPPNSQGPNSPYRKATTGLIGGPFPDKLFEKTHGDP